MAKPSSRQIGILAGGGSLPREIAEGLAVRGVGVHIVAIDGEADRQLDKFNPTNVNWGQIGLILSSFKSAGCRQIVFAGSVRRPDLSKIKPDLGFFRALFTVLRLIRVGGDDAILRAVIGFFERHGIEIVGVDQVAPELVVGEGLFAGPGQIREDASDIGLGFDVLRALAPFDVGQAVVVSDGRVEAIEGAEGTDRMLDRLMAARQRRMRERLALGRGILLKAPKPGQDLRVDMPAIGPETVRKVAGADLKGVAVEAGSVLALQRGGLIEMAKTHRVFVAGIAAVTPDAGGVEQEPFRSTADGITLRKLGRRAFSKSDAVDAIKGGRLLSALGRFDTGRGVVVVRRHVLAVEAGEGIGDLIERAAGLRQWGGGLFARRKGVLVLAAGRDLEQDMIAKAAEAGFAGIVVVLQKFAASVADSAISEADRRKVFIAALVGEG
ncbi:MAG: UDP-2,3-diacylglucosamine diphosphatase LpxI [Alphaproteobacteria bacterium]|nr:UDP-2,3-diacylglucosamine diphosphatase LpxI [Alphaproteobacteria bacterium]